MGRQVMWYPPDTQLMLELRLEGPDMQRPLRLKRLVPRLADPRRREYVPDSLPMKQDGLC